MLPERGLVAGGGSARLEETRQRAGTVIERFRRPAPKIAELFEAAEADLLAFYRFPAAHRSKLRSTNPLERLNKEIGWAVRGLDVDRANES